MKKKVKKDADGPFVPKGLGSGRVLNEKTLRANIGRDGDGGEAHHIIPDNIVQGMIAANIVPDASGFDDSWNGILLHGSDMGLTRPITTGAAPAIYHRKHGSPGHSQYDAKVRDKISGGENHATLAATLKTKIGGATGYLDNLTV